MIVLGCLGRYNDSGSYRVLIGIKAAVVESGVCVAHGYSEGGSCRVGLEVVDEVQVVRSEIRVAKRCVCGNWISVWTAASRASIEGGCDSQYGGIGVVEC